MTPFWATYFTLLAFFFGACVGSFLNVCIYRIPRGESVVHPRSHCPNCNKLIAWYDNIPLVSYVALRARCRNCGVGIIPRYFLVELLTAVLFLLVWNRYGFQARHPHYELIPVYWLALSGLILGTFVDFEHMLLPDRVTKGGMVIGIALSLIVPSMHNATSMTTSLMRSATGLAIGFGSLYAVAELGKLLFGKKRIAFDAPVDLSFEAGGEDISSMKIGDEVLPSDELFPRASDVWTFDATDIRIDGREVPAGTITFRMTGYEVAGETHPATALPQLRARITSYVFPREAMGFGDVKLMGAIGAFFGWPAVLFTVMISSVIGSLVGILLILAKKLEWQSRIPYGPYIAVACVIWMLGGRDWWMGYLAWITGAN